MQSGCPLKLLIVDDEETIVEYVQKIYQKRGFTTFGAMDGIKAVEIFQKEKPRISLIDIHMPFSPIDGVEVLRRIKKIDKDAVCIMVTRITEKDEVEAAKEAGASAYILKPMELDDLDKAIYDTTGIKL